MEHDAEPITFGKYELLERIAIGGMAEVFRARLRGEGGFEKHLVIKRILPHLSTDSEFVVMLIDEAKIAVCLSHPNIVQIYDLGKIQGTYFIAMEFIEGGDLKEILRRCARRGTRVPIHHAVFIATEVLKGLGYAHSKSAGPKDSPMALQIIHRDISPPNILLSYEGEVKIVDFGIAKASTRMMETAAGILKGKFEYMSPEQASGLSVDARTDLFSTALILYEMLTGKNPFLARADLQVLQNVRSARVLPPSHLNPEIPPALEQIILKALQRDSDKRYMKAGDLATDLLTFCYETGNVSSASKLAAFMRELFEEDMKAGRTASSAAPPRWVSPDESTFRRPAISRPDREKLKPVGKASQSPLLEKFSDLDVYLNSEGVTEATTLADLRSFPPIPQRKKPETDSRLRPPSTTMRPPEAEASRRDVESLHPAPPPPARAPLSNDGVAFSFFDNPNFSPDFNATFVPPPMDDDDSVTTIQQIPEQDRVQRRPSSALSLNALVADDPRNHGQPSEFVPEPLPLRAQPPPFEFERENPDATAGLPLIQLDDEIDNLAPQLPPITPRPISKTAIPTVARAPEQRQPPALPTGIARTGVSAPPPAAEFPARPPLPQQQARTPSVAALRHTPSPAPAPSIQALQPAPRDTHADTTQPANVSYLHRTRPAIAAFVGGTMTGFLLAHILSVPSCGLLGDAETLPQLTIRTVDGAETYVNSNRVGSAYPLTLSLTPDQDYLIQVVRRGYQDFETRVRLGPSESTTLAIPYPEPVESGHPALEK